MLRAAAEQIVGSSLNPLGGTKYTEKISIPSREYKVFYMEAPLSILSGFQVNLAELNGFHTGIGFQSTGDCDRYEFALDYQALNSLSMGTIFPDIPGHPCPEEGSQIQRLASQAVSKKNFQPLTGAISGQDLNFDLVWNNQSTVVYYNDINTQYWKSSDYMTTVTSDQMDKIQNFILNEWIPRNKFYSIARISTRDGGCTNLENTAVRDSTCDTFCKDLIQFISTFANIQYVTKPYVTVNTLCGDSYRAVGYQENKGTINAWYLRTHYIVCEIFLEAQVLYALYEKIKNASNIMSVISDILQFMVELYNLYTKIISIYSQPISYYYGYANDFNSDFTYYEVTNAEFFTEYKPDTRIKMTCPAKSLPYFPSSSSFVAAFLLILLIFLIFAFVFILLSKKRS